MLVDWGPACDPTKLKARPLEEIRPGGLGLHIIRGSMDAVEYTREGRANGLRFTLFGLSDSAREVLKISRLLKLFEVYENEQQAIAS